jgi:hypothetical protein
MEKLFAMPSSSIGGFTHPRGMMMMMKTRRRNEMPNVFGDEVCENGSAWSFCRPASSLVKSSVLRIEAAVAGGVERKDALVSSRKSLPTPGQVLLERLTRDNGIGNSGAMDELDLERGVCNPFRKYSPERVSYTSLFFSTVPSSSAAL